MNITTIIPVHEYNEKIADYFNEALSSLRTQEKAEDIGKVIVVYAAKLEDDEAFNITMKDIPEDVLDITYLKNEGDTDFASQINFAVSNINTDWFTILEFDDVFSKKFFYNVNNYIQKLGDDVSVFLPMMAEVNNEGALFKITNETVWSRQFIGENGELGYLNTTSLGEYIDFKISSGAIIKKDDFESCGGLKKNIKLSFTYEYLLRVLNNGYKICSLPKILVKHLVDRDGSLFKFYTETMSTSERRFWLNVAKKESNFTNDREIDTTLLNPFVENN